MAISSAVAALLKPQADRGRNMFPLDNKQVYSMKAGQITPVKALHFMPGDTFNMQISDFALTFPMQTAPFLRGRKEFSVYSVYYNAIWSLFNQAQSTRQDPKTSAFGVNPSLNEPRIALSQLYFACYEAFAYYIYYRYTFIVNGVIGDNVRRTWLGNVKGSFLDIDTDFNLATLLGNRISIGSTATDIAFLESQNADFYNSTYLFDIIGQPRVYNWIRKLDMLGYGNIYPLFKQCEQDIIDLDLDYTRTNGALSQNTIGSLKSCFESLWDNLFKCCVNRSTGQNVVKYVNLYSICAYNSIFYHFFRNSYYDNDYNPRNYNLDFMSVELNSGYCYMSDFSVRFLDIEYHQWKKDMFTATMPSTQLGAVSEVYVDASDLTATTSDDFKRWTSDDGIWPSASASVQTASSRNNLATSSTQLRHTHAISSLNGDAIFNVIALKRAEMLQEYRQTLMRAGNKTSDVFRAIYGGAPSSEHEDDVIPRFLDTFGIDIFVDPVTATADTGSSNPNGSLGDIAARGKFRGDSGRIKFNAGNNFGVMLTLAYVVPTAEYNSYMLDMHNCELSPEDHFLPQFENLGLEPLYSDELNMLHSAEFTRVLGYVPRYHHKKSQVDMVHGAFCSLAFPERFGSSGGMRVWNKAWYGEFNHWVSPRSDMQSRTATQIKDLYINPNVLDNVFVMAAGADLAEDQFICNTYFQISATRAMSKVGLINFV